MGTLPRKAEQRGERANDLLELVGELVAGLVEGFGFSGRRWRQPPGAIGEGLQAGDQVAGRWPRVT